MRKENINFIAIIFVILSVAVIWQIMKTQFDSCIAIQKELVQKSQIIHNEVRNIKMLNYIEWYCDWIIENGNNVWEYADCSLYKEGGYIMFNTWFIK